MFAPWEGWRKALGGVTAAFMVLLVIAFSIPLGIVAVGAMFLAAQIWKSPMDSPNYDRMQYTMMTRSYRVALFFVTVKQQAAVLFSPVILLGAGPPREDPDHDLQPGFWPPFRLSSWWSMLGALALAPLEILISPMRMSVIGGSLPWFIATALAIPGWYAFFQVLADARRLAPDKDAGALGDPPPATMLNKIDDHIELHPSLIRSAAFGAIPVVIVIILWITVKWPWWVTLIAVVLLFSFTAAILWSRNLMTEYRSAWVEREALAENWQSIWMSLLPVRAGSPLFSNEFDLPSVDEFEAELARWHREMDESDDLDASPPEYEVLVKCANFRYAPGQTYETVAGMTEGLRGALNAGLVGVIPFGETDPLGNEIPGTVNASFFRVFYSEQTTELPHLLDPNANAWATRLSIQAKILEPLAQVRGIGRCIVANFYLVTRPESPQTIICVKLRPRDPGVSVDVFLERLSDIQRAANVRWVRVGQGNDEGEIVMYLGDEPVIDVTMYNRPAKRENDTIDRMNWLYYFHSNQLRGASGTPRLVRREPTTPVVDKLTFSLPPGLPMKKIKAADEAIATSSGNEFIEIALLQPHDDTAPTVRSRGPAQPKPDTGTQFSIIAAKANPLRRVFNFTDFTDKVLTGREKGVAKINWATGVLSDDSLAYDDWGNSDNPHLLVAGASGAGKSVVMSSLILQLAANNGPGEVRIWMVEPKNEMQIYRDLDVTERFVDTWSPNGEFVKNAADMVDDAVAEMNRRNEAFVTHPKRPKQLKKAREIAIRESEQAGTPLERHPLYMPYLFIIIEECASLFSGVRKEERDDQMRLMGSTTELARKARSAGIHLILATQYPTKESLPVTIRNQCRSVGMKCQNMVASLVVIGEPGLEDINIKGCGKVRVNGEMRLFRGFWVQDGDPDYGEQNDIISTLGKLPSNNGQSSAMRKAGETPRIKLPELGESVFSLWDESASGGRAQASMVADGKGMYTPAEVAAAEKPKPERPEDIDRLMRQAPTGR